MRLLVAFAFALLHCGARTEIYATSEPLADSGTTFDAACHPRMRTVQVPVTAPWFDTGVDVPAGARLTISASGTARYGTDPRQITDANGGNFDGQKFFASSVLPNTIIVSLIGKLGGSVAVDTGTPLLEGVRGNGEGFVGVKYDRVVSTSGRLFLGFNDQRQAFGDNDGAFVVTIVVGC